jgi:hypothetical protein
VVSVSFGLTQLGGAWKVMVARLPDFESWPVTVILFSP